MNAKSTLAVGAAALALLVLLSCVGVVLPLLGGTAAQAQCNGPHPLANSSPSPPDGGWNDVQRQHAATIVAAGRQQGIPPRAWVIAVATAMQESSLRNLANDGVPSSLLLPNDGIGHNHDSVGLFQQRVSPPEGQGAWGTATQLMDPPTAAARFYTALGAVKGWWAMRLTDASQNVQRSATPEAYQRWEEPAEKLVAAISGVGSIGEIGGGNPLAPCGTAGLSKVLVGPKGWVQPVDAAVVSPYGQRDGRLHAGVDLGAGRNTPIHATSTGLVTKVRCDSGSGTCDRDGGINVSGCGWYVEVTTSTSLTIDNIQVSNVLVRYCHMVRRPEVAVGQRVAAGQVLGFVGSSGRSSGPHLHMEVHLNVGASQRSVDNSSSFDPEIFMNAVSAPLGRSR